MKLRITLKVKFRAFGITFGTVGPVTWAFPVDSNGAVLAALVGDKLHFNERGVKLDASLSEEEG